MKTKIKLFSDVPINILIIPVLVVFLFLSAVSMFYKNNDLTFYSIYSFYSLAKAETMAAFNWTNFGQNIPGLKEINGFLYPLMVSLLIKIVGKLNIVPVLYVFSFFVMLLISTVFYKIANDFWRDKFAILATLFFIISAPVALAVFSGSDAILILFLFVLNTYYIYFHASKKDYTAAFILSILLLFTNYTGIIFGLTSLCYLILSLNERKLKDDYLKKILLFLSCFILFCIVFCGYVFIGNITPSFIEENVLSNTKTFFVNTFFKDGFLWSKIMPPFFSIFFFISLYMRYANEIKERKISFTTYIFLISLASFVMEFFAIFSTKTDTILFLAPFFFLFIFAGMDGIFYLTELLQSKNPVFSKNNLLLGLILFAILYNIFWTFTLTIEKYNMVRYHHSNMYVGRFYEK